MSKDVKKDIKKDKAKKNPGLSSAVVKQLKSLIFPVIMLVIILGAAVYIITTKSTQDQEPPIRMNGYEGTDQPIVMENDELKFTLDPTTTQFALEVKSTGKVWYSNPQDADSDSIAGVDELGRLKSTLLMSYMMNQGLEVLYDNYNYSITNGIYDIEATKDCVKVSYSIGKVEREYLIPPVTTEARFKEWCAKTDKSSASTLQKYYKKYDINNPGKKDDVEALKASYPIYETEPIYVLREGSSKALKGKMERIFTEAGYTEEDLKADKELDQSNTQSDEKVYNVSMYYRLDGRDLVVEIPFSEMEYSAEAPLYTLSPLPYFGAGGKSDEGFLVVPEGGGALINFNNGKTAQNSYYANVYGWDMARVRKAVVHDTRTYYNTYGVSSGDDSFLCILEDGASYASVRADVSGRSNSYNYVNTVYSVVISEQYDLGKAAKANKNVYVFLPQLPQESLVQRYHFVDSGDYVDMAKEYRDYLKKQYGSEFAAVEDTSAPVVVEIVSAVDKVKQFLGVPITRPLKLTTFKEAREIMTELQSEGFQNMSLKLTGWVNGGVKQQLLKNVRLVSDCGSKKDLQNLSDAAASANVDLYLDGVTQYAYDSDLFDGFFSFTDAARFVSKERAEIFQYSAVTYGQREGADSYYLLHSDLAKQMADNLIKTVGKYKANVSFREIGMELSADYYKKKTVSREASRKQEMEQLAAASANGTKIMINMGNDYAMAYSDMITNMDLQGSEYTILDEYVPFYQLAIHGYKNYTGDPLNLAGDPDEELLRSAEYGAGLYFTIMKESPFVLQKTLYTEYYGSSYDAWHARMVETYSKYNRELGHTFKQEMTGHEILQEGLVRTTYADGTKVYVNYNFEDMTADGKTIPARDYMVVR